MKLPNTRTVLETAVALETTQRNILELIGEGKLDAINISKGAHRPRWLIPNEAIEKYRPTNLAVDKVADVGPKPKKRHV